MSEFLNLANSKSLTDILSTPTETKAPDEKIFQAPKPEIVSTGNASEESQEAPVTQNQPQESSEASEQKRKMTAEESAESLVAMLDGIITPTFTALQWRKFKKAFTDEERKTIDQASVKASSEQTPEEKGLVGKFERLEREMKARMKEVPFTDEEFNRLQRPAVILCKQNNIDIPPGLAFSMVAMQLVSNRVVDLIAS